MENKEFFLNTEIEPWMMLEPWQMDMQKLKFLSDMTVPADRDLALIALSRFALPNKGLTE